MRTDARKEHYERVEVGNIQCLLTDSRIDPDTVPEEIHRYELRGSDYDWSIPVCVDRSVVVNFTGTLLAIDELPLVDNRLMLAEDGDNCLNYLGYGQTLREFCEEQGRLDVYPKEQIRQEKIEEIVRFIVNDGLNNSAEGNWCMYYEEIEDKCGVNLHDDPEMAQSVLELLCERSEISDIDFNGADGCYDCNFYTDYLRNADVEPSEKEDEIRALVVRPGEKPVMEQIKNELHPLQDVVGGYLEMLDMDDGAAILCNEEGKVMGLEANRHLGDDIICGTFIVCGTTEEGFASLSTELEEKYMEKFSQPESFTIREQMGLAMFTM